MSSEQFVTKLKQAIEAAFKKDSAFEKMKIKFHEGAEPKGGVESKDIEVYIRENTECEPGFQYYIMLYVPAWQGVASIYISETIEKKNKNVLVSSCWRADIHKNLIITTVTRK